MNIIIKGAGKFKEEYVRLANDGGTNWSNFNVGDKLYTSSWSEKPVGDLKVEKISAKEVVLKVVPEGAE